ncbi:hypothetical protein K501DRAFT_280513 [Backusella circina FSU 941]|nr:hypothetical protein K501DRAFT_280513 [Backusella circina FSU 941]
MDFIKTHYTEAPFPLKEFFTFLDISSKIQAENKFKELINEISTLRSINPKLKSFASRIISDNFIKKILEQSGMGIYWKNIELDEDKRQLALNAELIAAQREIFITDKNLEFTRSLAEGSSRSREPALTMEDANNANDMTVKISSADENSMAVKSSDADEEDFLPIPTISLTSDEFRNLVFKCGSWALKDDISLSSLRDLNFAVGSLRPQTLGKWLDILSHQILNLDLDTVEN